MDTAENGYEVSVTTNRPVAEAVSALAGALRSRGYGVLGTIDVRKTLKEKAGRDVNDFIILDVCNPMHALNVIGRTDKAGLILPCKLSLREEGSGTRISMLRPGKVFGLIGDPALADIAGLVEEEITSAMQSVAGD